MSFCVKCGKELNEQEKFCPECGTVVESPEEVVAETVGENKGYNVPKCFTIFGKIGPIIGLVTFIYLNNASIAATPSSRATPKCCPTARAAITLSALYEPTRFVSTTLPLESFTLRYGYSADEGSTSAPWYSRP